MIFISLRNGLDGMSYYVLNPAVDNEETGPAYPAAVSYNDYNFNAANSAHKLTFREFLNFIPDLRFKLAQGAATLYKVSKFNDHL